MSYNFFDIDVIYVETTAQIHIQGSISNQTFNVNTYCTLLFCVCVCVSASHTHRNTLCVTMSNCHLAVILLSLYPFNIQEEQFKKVIVFLFTGVGMVRQLIDIF